MSSTSDRTPEQSARAVLGSLPRGLVLVVPFIQRVVLGLRLELRPSQDHLLGWKIAARGEDHWLAALVWPPVSLVHRQVARVLVRGAARVE